jgi:hypothetical protein
MKVKKKRTLNPNSLKNLKHIKKGQVLNPRGGNAHNPEMKMIKELTIEGLKECVTLMTMGTLADLKIAVENPESSSMHVGVAKCMFDAINRGDWNTIERIIERVVGKVTVHVDHTSNGKELAPRILVKLPSNGYEVRIPSMEDDE